MLHQCCQKEKVVPRLGKTQSENIFSIAFGYREIWHIRHGTIGISQEMEKITQKIFLAEIDSTYDTKQKNVLDPSPNVGIS
jgi:hypothetical protein